MKKKCHQSYKYHIKWKQANDHKDQVLANGPLARYTKLRVAHTPGMPGTYSAPLRVSDPDMHQDICVTHVP